MEYLEKRQEHKDKNSISEIILSNCECIKQAYNVDIRYTK